jgi:predicted nucleic acid-binding protein
VRLLFDTNILIAGSVPGHPNREGCLPLLQEVVSRVTEGYISTHSLSEYYRYMTGKAQPQLSPKNTEKAIRQLLINFTAVSLDEGDYLAVFARMRIQSLHGAIVYDAIIAQAALKAEVDYIVTLNTYDFKRLGADVASLVFIFQ